VFGIPGTKNKRKNHGSPNENFQIFGGGGGGRGGE